MNRLIDIIEQKNKARFMLGFIRVVYYYKLVLHLACKKTCTDFCCFELGIT